MMKLFITILLLQLNIFAHTLVFDTIDNEDGTMEVIGMFSTGASAEGATVKIISLANSKVIFQERIPSTGSIIIDIPKEPYKLILDSGPGHKIERDGKIEPIGGFTNILVKKINYAFYTTLSLSILFFILSFILYIKRIKRVNPL